MIMEELLVMILFGAITSIIIELAINVGKKPFFTLFMGLLGATAGFSVGIITIFFTRGFGFSYEELLIVVIITALISILSVEFFKDKLPKPSFNVKPWAVASSILLILILSFTVVIPYFPVSGSETDANITLKEPQGALMLKTLTQDNSVNMINVVETNSIPMDISIEKSAVRFPFLEENPSAGDYLGFEVKYTVSNADWQTPVMAIIVAKDVDSNGELSAGDLLWPTDLYKYPTNTGTNWRITVVHHNNGGIGYYWYESGGTAYICQSYHATMNNIWTDESNMNLVNTPEAFICPTDMISADSNGNIKEDLKNWVSIPEGTASTVKGSIFCPSDAEYQGSHLIFAVAIDLNGNIIASQNHQFTISGGSDGGGGGGGGGAPDVSVSISSYVIGTLLFTGLAGAVYYVPKYLGG